MFDIVNPQQLVEPKGWNHGMLAEEGGRILFVAGQTAHDREGNLPSDEFTDQFDAALQNVIHVVEAAGGKPEHIGQMTIYVTDRATYLDTRTEVGAVYRKMMGKHFPAMALVEVSGLVDPDALVEIQAMAVVPTNQQRE